MAASASPSLDLVLSGSGKAHRMAVGPPLVPLHMAATVCGWRFGNSTAIFTSDLELPSGHKDLCEKCFGELKAARKSELGLAARQIAGAGGGALPEPSG